MPRSGARAARSAPRAAGPSATSTADREHLDAGQVRGPGAAELGVTIVAGAPGRPDPCLELRVVGAVPKWRPEVGPARREEAREQLALGREPRAGASPAERRGHRRDHADLAGLVAVAEAGRNLA